MAKLLVESPSAALSRGAILTFKPTTRSVELPGIDGGGHVVIRELTAAEVIQFVKQRDTDPAEAIYGLIIMATMDDKGAPLFKPEDAKAVAGLPYQISNTIVEAIFELSDLNGDAKKKRIAAASK